MAIPRKMMAICFVMVLFCSVMIKVSQAQGQQDIVDEDKEKNVVSAADPAEAEVEENSENRYGDVPGRSSEGLDSPKLIVLGH